MASLAGRLLAAVALLALACGTALAQTYPDRPLRIVVPFAAGAGVLDIMARLVGQHLGAKRQLGVEIRAHHQRGVAHQQRVAVGLGVGTTPYLATELLKSMAGIDVVHVPYKGRVIPAS
jgi:tripartite-type tricarboxylate transporter receptor subunit TctC